MEDSAKEMFKLSAQLKHYKRRDIQEEIALHSLDKEIAFRYGSKGFGKRPDIISYPTDVLAAAKKGCSSFHASQERWSDILALKPGMRPKEFEEIRIGWDLVLDIDCPNWEHAKIVSDLLIKALKKKGVESISCKFSGNKGFHIGVPFETFPYKVQGRPVETAFPDGVHKIASYLAYLIDSKEMDYALSNAMLALGKENIAKQLGLPIEKLTAEKCEKCGQPKEMQETRTEYFCRNNSCKSFNRTALANESKKIKNICPECGELRDKIVTNPEEEERCKQCGGTSFKLGFNSSLVLDLDTQLISARHMYRMPWSMHEKSGLVSIPIDPDKVLEFEKEMASSDKAEIIKEFRFLDRETATEGEATSLLIDAWDHWDSIGGKAGKLLEEQREADEKSREVEIPDEAVPEEHFPPCIQLGFQGMRDGRKRFIFALVNFLHSLGWSYKMIEERLKKWNELNPEPLSDTLLIGQVRYHKQMKKRVLPPNCKNKAYYVDIAICKPDGLCQRIKNPVSYAKRKAGVGRKGKKKRPKKKE